MSGIQARCTICTSSFHSNNIAALSCGHTFHYQCILQWLEHASPKSCPICRARTTDRQVVRQLFFDAADLDQTIPADLGAKVEELSLALRKEADEHTALKEKYRLLDREGQKLQDRLKSEKKRNADRVPQLESQLNEVLNRLKNQEDIERELEEAKSKLKAAKFYQYVTKSGKYEEGIKKYINDRGDPEAGQFLILMRKQLDDTNAEHKKTADALIETEKKLRESEKKNGEYKNLVQALQKETNEWRMKSESQTPYNPKLAKVLDQDTPRRTSLGFETSVNFSEDLVQSVFKPTVVAKGSIVTHTSRSKATVVPFSFEDDDMDFMPSTSSDRTSDAHVKVAEERSRETADSLDDIAIPKNIRDRVKAGSPKKKPTGFGGSHGAAMKSLENLEFREFRNDVAPRTVALSKKPSITLKRKAEPTKKPGKEVMKTARLSMFFTKKTSSSSSIGSNSEVITLE